MGHAGCTNKFLRNFRSIILPRTLNKNERFEWGKYKDRSLSGDEKVSKNPQTWSWHVLDARTRDAAQCKNESVHEEWKRRSKQKELIRVRSLADLLANKWLMYVKIIK